MKDENVYVNEQTGYIRQCKETQPLLQVLGCEERFRNKGRYEKEQAQRIKDQESIISNIGESFERNLEAYNKSYKSFGHTNLTKAQIEFLGQDSIDQSFANSAMGKIFQEETQRLTEILDYGILQQSIDIYTKAGYSIYEIENILGHKNIERLNIYLKVKGE